MTNANENENLMKSILNLLAKADNRKLQLVYFFLIGLG